MTVTTPGLEIVMTRSFNAPRELVFEAHTSCEHVRNWWGPRKYDVAECELDFRPGGKWRIVHKGDGQEIAFFGEYREIDRPNFFTWTFGFDGMPGDPGVEHYTFEETDGVTTLTARAKFSSPEERDAVLNSGMQEGAAETWDRLEEYLETLRK
jgi:uncharacterized protein YndB with AHSA1/START domain